MSLGADSVVGGGSLVKTMNLEDGERRGIPFDFAQDSFDCAQDKVGCQGAAGLGFRLQGRRR